MPSSSLSHAASASLLRTGDGEPAEIVRPDGAADFVIACDHAGCRIPDTLGTLGLSDRELASHIAWDPGAREVAAEMSRILDATLVLQNFSRLVIDCNRDPAADDSIAGMAEWGPIAGNAHLTPQDRAQRRESIFHPYHAALNEVLEARGESRRRTILVAVHSFTPSLRGEERPWHIGVMFGPNARLAQALVASLQRDERLKVGINQPYSLDDQIDYTLPVHAGRRGIPHLGIEIRQDLIAGESGQLAWGRRLSSLLRQAVAATPDANVRS